MKSRNNRLFWSALGAYVLDEGVTDEIESLPVEMQNVFNLKLSVANTGKLFIGENLTGRKGRHIYMYSWKILRENCFSRSFKKIVFPGVELFIPFFRERVVVTPQGFRDRVPSELRARALVGKSVVLQSFGYTLVVVTASYEKEVWGLLKTGGCYVTTPDKLAELLSDLF